MRIVQLLLSFGIEHSRISCFALRACPQFAGEFAIFDLHVCPAAETGPAARDEIQTAMEA
jgi:hypothetical protein